MPNILAAPTGVLAGSTPRPKLTAKVVSPPEDDYRDFGDSLRTRQTIYGGVLKAAQGLEPMANQRHTLTLRDVSYIDPEDISYRKQKEAILSGATLGRRISGTWDLTDNATGELLDTRKATVAKVPYLTNRGTFINNGNEYTLSNQMRLRSGIFTRIKDNGEIEAHANILPGKGVSHRYFLEPEKGIFYIRIGQAKIPLMPLVKALGAKDSQLQEAWGNELWQTNAQKDDPSNLNKLYQRLVRKADPEAEHTDKITAIKEVIEKMELDEEVTQRTLGAPYKNLGLDSILATTRKLLAVSRGEEDVDDRDHLAFQTIMGPEDLFSERIAKDYGGIRRNTLFRSSFRGNLDVVQPGMLTRQLEAALLSSGLGQSLEEINPADIFDKQNRISRLGEGGIPSIDAVPDEARAVQPSHMGFVDPVRTPESFKVGVDVHIANKVRKGRDGRFYAPFTDRRTGKTVWKSPQDLADLTVAFPREMEKTTKRVAAMRGGKLKFVNKKDVDLVLPNFENAFSPLGNMVPMKSAVKAQRMAMASRMLTQALPLENPEAPLVQTGTPDEDDVSFEDRYGRFMGAVHADRPGRVISVNDHGIKVKYDDGTTEEKEIYNNFPYNRKTYIHNTPTVRPGDVFGAGDILARSNFTDEAGTTALGTNLRVAYIPFRGMNFEDALAISESAAKKFSSEHMYQHGVDWSDEYKRGKKSFATLFPSKYDRAVLDTLDDDGVIKEGATVEYGHPLVLAAKKKDRSHGKVHRKREAAYSDQSEVWKHHSPGVVTDIFKGPKGTTVLVKSLSPAQVGDKLSGRYGDKGVISTIIPDDEMPGDAEGRPYEMLLNPLGIISRTNPAQMIEAALGKIAAITGKPYKVKDFEDIDDLTEYALDELRKHGLKDLEDILDPETGRKVPNIFTGNRFFMKLHHTAEAKGQGRGIGGYTMAGTPAKGGETGSKIISLMDNNALLSHGATEVLRDSGAIRGQRNEEFWLPFMQGLTPPKPKVPLIYEKFVNELRGSGINVVEDGSQMHIMALTDKDIDKMAGNRYIKTGDTVRFEKGMKPIAGGLFDPTLTGGHDGNRWAAIKLEEPMPNPVMEEPIRRLLGLTQKKFEDVLAGKHEIATGTGPKAIKRALAKLNIDKELENARAQIKSGRKTHRDAAVRKLGYLKAAKRLNIHPQEWMLNKVPVLPPKFRPVSVMSDSRLPLVPDANYLYKELLEANDNLREMKKEVDDVGDEQLATYNAFKAVVGLGDPLHPKLQEKRVKGLLRHVFGTSPKLGTVQRRLISSTVDLVGRAVITPNPDLDMDHVGLPEDRAWDVYKNFIVRRLKRRGMSLVEASKQVEDRGEIAKQELLKEIETRPVIINRAPVLHRFGIMAFYPKLIKGDTLQVSPLIVGGFNADFDGDAMQYHVPVSDEARDEAVERMLPSRNLLDPSDFKSPMHKPSQEYTGGLYAATARKSKRRVQTFRNIKDLLAAYKRGETEIDDPAEIME
jgi:DNA-directed RNA polymerase subunit beta